MHTTEHNVSAQNTSNPGAQAIIHTAEVISHAVGKLTKLALSQITYKGLMNIEIILDAASSGG